MPSLKGHSKQVESDNIHGELRGSISWYANLFVHFTLYGKCRTLIEKDILNSDKLRFSL